MCKDPEVGWNMQGGQWRWASVSGGREELWGRGQRDVVECHNKALGLGTY
jgi:hypothetical protein